MKKIALVTATRAEYCFLVPVIKRLQEDNEIVFDLIVTGTHLSKEFGYTVTDIEMDGFRISKKIEILSSGNTRQDTSITMANAIVKFATYFRRDKPDMLILSGDRTEILAIAITAMNELIPVAHLHGGEVTEGAVDDCIRHALTKMSYLHFTTTETYRNRVIQLGEAPGRVFNVGSLGTENILNAKLWSESEVRKSIGIPMKYKYAVVAFHPVTLEKETISVRAKELCCAMKKYKDIFFVITGSNADAGGKELNDTMKEFTKNNKNTLYCESLGMIRFLTAIKYSEFLLGNSSSGITEAPVLGIPTVNIGDRQKGRIMVETIINCEIEKEEIICAIDKALSMPHKQTQIYGNGNTSSRIVEILKDFLCNRAIDLKKGFFDIDYAEKD